MSYNTLNSIRIEDFGIGIFIGLTFQNTLDNIATLYGNMSIINGLQLLASVMNLAYTLFMAITFSAIHIDCHAYAVVITIIYAIFQVLSIGLIITRSTVLIAMTTTGLVIRYTLYFLAVGLTVLGSSSTFWTVTWINADGTCAASFPLILGSISGIGLVCIYCIMLLSFLIPIRKHIVKLSTVGGTQYQLKRLESTTLRISLKISLAILCYLITGILSFSQVINSHFRVYQVSQTYYCLIAATWACIPSTPSPNTSKSNPESGLAV